MKKRHFAFYLIAFFTTFLGFAQEEVLDQNPNYKKSMAVYLNTYKETTLTQGTTSQETYKAIDPLQDRRDLRNLRRKYRANSRLWRHQERMERAKNTQYIEYEYPADNYYNGYYSNNWSQFNTMLSLGLFYGLIL
ncbi:hypothetical protein JL193_11690 [Polaribacter batillariae]|uniref:DUF5683 domain-containing protein n=1 Tax=Polaribacter batillariae TaxID=2808900 RepID=A0ABX7SRM1_9FLAO|nr:hypothetical protein [Polaribacter batillariae]QTD36791.1 hypothetical protein JL193_11690 [Polaribacter batillariae]